VGEKKGGSNGLFFEGRSEVGGGGGLGGAARQEIKKGGLPPAYGLKKRVCLE